MQEPQAPHALAQQCEETHVPDKHWSAAEQAPPLLALATQDPPLQ